MFNITGYIQKSIEVKESILKNKNLLKKTKKVARLMNSCFKKGNKILIAGNGGSAADAQHFAAEIVGRYRRERKGYPAIALTTDTSIITAWSNDYDFRSVFSRQVQALSKPGDIFIGISTSGTSANLVEALHQSKKMKIKTICFLGKDGGKMKDLCDISLIVPSNQTSHVQESHIMLIHVLCEEVEKKFQ